MNEKREKEAFPRGGKSKNAENRLSATGENQKSAKIGFPNIGKTRNQRKTTFPILGRIKNAIGCISQLPERRKTSRVFYLTFGVRFILTHPLAGTTPQSMTADIFLSMLLAREWDHRAQAAIVRLTRNAAFRYKACLEQIDYATNQGLERNQMERLATLDFVHKEQNLFITGSSGTGKAIWHVPSATRHAKGDSVLSMPMHPNCLAHWRLPKPKVHLKLSSRRSSGASCSSLTTYSLYLLMPGNVPSCSKLPRTGMKGNPLS